MIKKFFEEHSDTLWFAIPLSLFSIIGFLLLYFEIRYPENVPIYGWVLAITFSVIPLIILYGIIFGFSVSEKQVKAIESRKDKLVFNEEGLTIEMPLFDKSCFIAWNKIDAITYHNYYVSSDFMEHYEGYRLFLNTLPIYTKYEKQWWLNRWFQKDSNRKVLEVKSETKNFTELPKMIEKYLGSVPVIDFSNPLKGELISTKSFKRENELTVIEKWTPGITREDQIVFDRFRRSLEEIKSSNN